MLKRKEILIIGNGRSVLEQSLGTHIDDFSTIGRIKNFSINNFSEFIGNKTYILFN